MYKFRIYAGMSGGFGGSDYIGTFEYPYEDFYYAESRAEIDARDEAIAQYQSYEGSNGILSWEDCKEALQEMALDNGTTVDDGDINEMYQEELESWIIYYVELEKEEA